MNETQTNIQTAESETGNSSGRYLQTMVGLHLGDCLDILPTIPDKSIDLTITSPPYFNAKSYSQYRSYSEYLDFLNSVFQIIIDKTKEAGILVVNVSCVIEPRISRNNESRRYPIPFDLCSILSKTWNFIDDIIWVKPDGASNRAIKFSHHRRPCAYKTFNVTEYILVFSRPGCLIDKSIQKHTPEIILRSLVSDGYERTNVWKINPERNLHPAPFPIKLAEKCVTYYSFINDTILDPFLGSGTTGIACKNLNRNFIGIEKNAKYFKYAETRIENHKPQMGLL